MALKLSERLKDYITIWNEAISGLYMVFGVSMISSMIAITQSCLKFKSKYNSYSGGMSCNVVTGDNVVALLFIVIMFVAGITNFFYTRKYFRGGNPKTLGGYAAAFALAISNGYIAYLIIKALSSTSSASVSTLLFSGSSWMIWIYLIGVIISLITSIMAIVMLFSWSPMTIDSEEAPKKLEIAADVPTHAMGHDAPTVAQKNEKDLPPMLNANPDAPVASETMAAEHKIVADAPSMAEGNANNESSTPSIGE